MSLVDEIREKLAHCLEPTYVPFDHEDIDKFVSNGGDFKNALIVHSLSEIRDCHHIMTNHGFIGFNYNPYLPPNSMWIVNRKGVKGELYPCKPDIFAATYELADPTPPVQPDTGEVIPDGD